MTSFKRGILSGFFLLLLHLQPVSSIQAADGDVVEGQYLIKLKDSSSTTLRGEKHLNFLLDKNAGSTLGQYKDLKGIQHIQLSKKGVQELKDELGEQIEYIEPVYKVWAHGNLQKSAGLEIDPVWKGAEEGNEDTAEDFIISSKLWGLENTKGIDIDITRAWGITRGERDIVVAVIDSGIDYNHSHLRNNLWSNPLEIEGNGKDDDGNGFVDDIMGWDFYANDARPYDYASHGTHVSGIVAGNGTVIQGAAPNVRIMPLRFLGGNGSGSTSDAIRAIYYAIRNGAHIINASWGGGGYSQALKDAISAAMAKGILFVASAGNNGVNLDFTKKYPASYGLANMVVVASVTSTGARSSSSNYGKKVVHVGAPGASIYSTVPKGFGYKTGTSMAAPYVAGTAALIWSQTPSLLYGEVKGILMGTVRPLSSMKDKTISGGMINAGNALETGPVLGN